MSTAVNAAAWHTLASFLSAFKCSHVKAKTIPHN